MTKTTAAWGLATSLALGMGVGMACGDETECGPTEAVVVRVYDGDTIELDSGERVRYLLVDTPELTGDPECYATEATQFNRTLVEGKTVQLSYDAQCTDRYDRLLAYISINGASVNERLISQGYACVLQIPPNGEDRAAAYRQLQTDAQADLVGLWGTCAEVPC